MTLEELAEQVGDKIEYEEGVKQAAEFEANDSSTPKGRQRTRFRDAKRAESKIVAFREVLQLLLDELQPVNTPDVDSYMAKRPSTI